MLVIVEGHTDKDFIDLYCKYLEVEIKSEQICCTGGNKYSKKDNEQDGIKNVKEKICKALSMDERILVILDADDDMQKSLENIHTQLDLLDAGLKGHCEIFLMPNNKDAGNLETLLEHIAKEKCILKCFDNYTSCIVGLQSKNPNIKLPNKKAKVFAYLSSFGFKNGDKNFKMDDNILNLQSPYLDNLKDFLTKGIKVKIKNKH